MNRRSGSSPVPKTRAIDRRSVLPLDDRAGPLANFMTVLRALHVAPEGLTFHELSSTMAASTLRDTLQQLVESGLVRVSASARYLATGALQIELSPSQILALLFFPHQPSNSELWSEIASISDDVRGTLQPETLRWVELIRNLALAQSSPPCGNADEQAFETVVRALSEGRLLSIQYSSRDGYPERRIVEPLLLWTRTEGSYLAAYCRTCQVYYNFSFGSLCSVTILNETFTPRSLPPLATFDPETAVRRVDALSGATLASEDMTRSTMGGSAPGVDSEEVHGDTHPATPISKRFSRA